MDRIKINGLQYKICHFFIPLFIKKPLGTLGETVKEKVKKDSSEIGVHI